MIWKDPKEFFLSHFIASTDGNFWGASLFQTHFYVLGFCISSSVILLTGVRRAMKIPGMRSPGQIQSFSNWVFIEWRELGGIEIFFLFLFPTPTS